MSENNPTLLISNEQLARTGSPEAIARYLSESLSHLNVSVKVLIQKLPDSNSSDRKRLWAICTCHYSPDASLIAEPIAQQLRDLELDGFKEAIIRAQVRGEIAPDWVLQVDLTRTEEMLRDWARWGDIQSIDRLLNECLAPQGLQVGTVLKETTLHIFCAWDFDQVPQSDVPAKDNTVASIQKILENLAPQGLTGATIYGVKSPELQGFIPHESPTLALDHLRDAPVWVHWLELPAATDPYLAPSTTALANQKNRGALTFLMQRLLNPDIDSRLATGGIRVKLCFKNELLHIMTEAVVCPRQTHVAGTIEEMLNSLNIVGVSGARIYGRRAGQNAPLWSYGIDFESQRPMLEAAETDLIAVPEFQEVEATLTAEEMEVTPEETLSGWDWWRQMLQRGLCATHLFMGQEDDPTPTILGTPAHRREEEDNHTVPIALIWGLLGCLLTLQVDWMGRQYFPTSPPVQEVATEASSPAASDAEKKATQAAILAAARSNNPSFNNPLLEEKLALYQARVEQSGPPDILIVGSSRALRGIDPTVLKEAIAERQSLSPEEAAALEVFNFGINGATAQVVDFVVRNLLTRDQLPQLVIWADGARAFNSGRPDLTFEAIAASEGYRLVEQGRFPQGQDRLYPHSNQFDFSLGAMSEGLSQGYQEANRWFTEALGEFSALYQKRDRLKSWLSSQLSSTLPTQQESNPEEDPQYPDVELVASEDIDRDGFLALDLRFDPDTYYQSHPKVTGAYDQDYDSFALAGQQYEALRRLMVYLNRHDVGMIFVNLPLTNEYLDPVRSKYERRFQNHMQDAEDRYGLVFRNLAKRWQNRHSYFSDPNHPINYSLIPILLKPSGLLLNN
ncbi:MAG: DUF1574 domain-containing protein [Kamptonema sp. SIO4C4]|nr:DUF1574 domain-containing protein [Kamptonema sp. SIO4C4]